MAHGDAAQLAAVLGAVGIPLLLAVRGRIALLGGLAVVGLAEALLAYALVPVEDLSRLWAGPLQVLALLFALGAVGGLAALLVRRPALAPIALLVVAPFRVPLELGGQRAFLLVPLYGVLAAALAALVWRTARGEDRAPLPLVLAVPVALFVGVTAISLIWTQDLRAGTVQLLFFYFPFTALLAVVGRAPIESWTARAIVGTVVALGSLSAAIGVWQVRTQRLFFAPDLEVANAYTTFFRVTSLFKDPSLYGRFLVLALALLVAALWVKRADIVLVAPLCVLLFAGLYFSYSQSSLVTLFVVLVAVTLVGGNRLARRAVAIVVVACVVGGGIGVALTVRGESAKTITSARSSLVRGTFEVFARHPGAGVGVGGHALAVREEAGGSQAVRRNVSHTTPLTVAAETGVIGLVAYSLLLLGAATALLLIRRFDRPLALGLWVVLLTLVVHSLFYSGFFEDPVTWGALGIMGAALTPAAAALPRLREVLRTAKRKAFAVGLILLTLALAGAATAAVLALRKPPSGKLDTELEGVSVIAATQAETEEVEPPLTPPPPPRGRKRPPADTRCWNQFGGDPQRRLARADLKLGRPTKPLWARGLKSYIEFPAVYCEGELYVNTYRGDTFAIDALTGQTVWRRRGGKKPSSPAIAGPRLIVTSKDGSVRALLRKNGRELWRIQTSAVESSPVVVGPTVFFGVDDGRLFAANVSTGRVRWAYDTGGRINSSPTIAGNRVCITTYSGAIFCLDRRNGRKLWSKYFKRDSFRYHSFYASASTDGRRLFTISRSGSVFCVRLNDGKLLWKARVGGLGYSTPAIASGRVFVGGFDGYLRAFRSTSGRLLWRRHVGGRVLGPAFVAGDLVFVATLEQRTFALRAVDGRPVWRIGIGKYSPGIVTEGHYYLTLNGMLVAFRGQRTPGALKRAEDAFFAKPASAGRPKPPPTTPPAVSGSG